MEDQYTKINLSNYMLTLNVYSFEACAILVVMGDLSEPLYTTYFDYTAPKNVAADVVRNLIIELYELTDNGNNKFVAMSVPVEPSFFGRTNITDNRDLLVRTLRESELFQEYRLPDNVPSIDNNLAIVTDDSAELIDKFLEYASYNIDSRLSENDAADTIDHLNNPISDDSVFYDQIKMEDGRHYYLYFKRRKGVVSLPNSESFSIIYRDPYANTVFTVSVNIIIDIVSINITYSDKVNIEDHHYSAQAFVVYMLKCKDILETAYKNGRLNDGSEQSAEYMEYIAIHIANVKRAFDKYGHDLCEAIGANYDTVAGYIEDHDKSKYSDEEFIGYRDYFYPDPKDKRSEEVIKTAFHMAWLHHIHNNPHHPEYWNIPTGAKSSTEQPYMKLIDMPPEHIVVMLCDWQSFSYIGKGNAYSYFYEEKNYTDKVSLMSSNTIELVKKGLDLMHV